VLEATHLRGFLGLVFLGTRYARSFLLYFNLFIIVFAVHLHLIFEPSTLDV